jgi:hypothetical protein
LAIASTEAERAQVRVARLGARLELELPVRREEPVEEGGLIHGWRIGRMDPPERDRVREPRAVRQQVAGRDPPCALLRPEPGELRNVRVDRGVQVEDALLNQPHRRGGGDDLGHREPRANHLRRCCDAAREIGLAGTGDDPPSV